MIDRLARLLTAHRAIVAVGAVFVTLIAIYGNQVDDPKKRGWQRAGRDPDAELLSDVRDDFDLEQTDTFLVIECDQLFTPDGIKAARAMVDAIDELPQVGELIWVDRIPILNVFGLPEPLIPESAASPESFAAAREKVLENPLVAGQLISSDGRTLLIPIKLDWLEVDNDDAAANEILETAENALAGHPAVDIQVRMTGRVPVFISQRESFQRNHRKFRVIGYVLVFSLAAFLFRGVVPVIIVGGVPALGVYWATGIIAILGQEVNALTNVILPVLLTMIGLTDGVHLFIHIRHARHNGHSAVEASRIGIQRVGMACFLTSVTTSIGFGSLLLAHSEFVQSFGRACGIGVLIQFVAVIALIPLLCASPLGRNIAKGSPNDLVATNLYRFRWVVDWTMAHARGITAFAILSTLALIAVAATLRPDDKTEFGLPSNSESLLALQHCDQAFGGIDRARIVVEWNESIDAESAEIMDVILDVEKVLAEEPLVQHPLSIRNIVATFPGDTDLPERMPFLQLLPNSLKSGLFNTESRRALINVRVQDIGIAAYIPVFDRLENEFEELVTGHPDFTIRLTGGPVVRARTLHRIVTDLAASLGAASLIILVVLAIAYRSLRVGLITIIPNMFPLLVTAALLVLMDRALDMASVCAFTVCLGIAVDDTIHFLSRYFEEQRNGADMETAIERSFLGVGAALIQTTAILIVGFLAVLTSELPGQRTFAAMACSTIGAALIGDLIFLPAMLICFGRPSRTRDQDVEHDQEAGMVTTTDSTS